MLLQYIHITFLFHDAIYFVKCTSPSCSKAPPQHDAATSMLHGWDGVLWLANLPLYPPNITMVIMAKQFYFRFIRPEDISPKSMIFVSMCSCKPLSFLWRFWSSGFFLSERPFRLCQYRTRFTVDIDTFVPVCSSIFTRSFAAVLGLICTFRTNPTIVYRQIISLIIQCITIPVGQKFTYTKLTAFNSLDNSRK